MKTAPFYLEKTIILMKKMTAVKCSLFMLLICLTVTGVEANTMSFESLYGGITERQGESIISELKQIRILLGSIEKKIAEPKKEKRKPYPKKAAVSIRGAHIIGNPKAPVTLVEFSDYQCPFCVKFAKKVYPKLKKKYIDTGKLRVVIRSMPLSFHKLARKAAQAAYCAAEQGKFAEMHDKLFAKSPKLAENFLIGYAKQLALDIDAFKGCLNGAGSLNLVNRDTREANKTGIRSIPAFVIGASKGNDKVTGMLVVGAKPFTVFEKHIERLLRESQNFKY